MRRSIVMLAAGCLLGSGLAFAAGDSGSATPGAGDDMQDMKAPDKKAQERKAMDDEPWSARAVLVDADGTNVGRADLLETPNGVKIRVEFRNMEPGVHAFHIHETGKCSPSFKAAGGHFNPTHRHHGFNAENGRHLGDLPNIHIPESGALTLEVYAPHATLNGSENKILDDDGSALVVHRGADDEKTDPAGDAGDRIACGVIVLTGTAAETDLTAAPPI